LRALSVRFAGRALILAPSTRKRPGWLPAPMCFEAGTSNIGDAVGLGAAIDYLDVTQAKPHDDP
jgi:selenocysteine lyase/cysteine desulfurase